MAGGAALALVAGLLALPEPAAGRLPLAQPSGSTVAASTVAAEPGVQRIIPSPVQAHNTGAAPFVLDPHSRIVAHGNAKAVGNYLSGLLRPATGHQLPTTSAQPKHGDVLLDLGPARVRRVTPPRATSSPPTAATR
jgi:hexosaminidase